jgi:hypothetical protein
MTRLGLTAALSGLAAAPAAAQWTIVNLHPDGAYNSQAFGVDIAVVNGRRGLGTEHRVSCGKSALRPGF